jgi:hypothetical protein
VPASSLFVEKDIYDMDDASGLIPFVATAALTLVAGVFTAAALADEEADNNDAADAAIERASSVIAACLYSGRSSKRGTVDVEAGIRRKKYIRWDRDRAKSSILDDDLGAHRGL